MNFHSFPQTYQNSKFSTQLLKKIFHSCIFVDGYRVRTRIHFYLLEMDQNPILFTKSPKIDWTSVLGSRFLESPNTPQFDVTQKPYQFPLSSTLYKIIVLRSVFLSNTLPFCVHKFYSHITNPIMSSVLFHLNRGSLTQTYF